jgi:SAM-dependent methyltransferase
VGEPTPSRLAVLRYDWEYGAGMGPSWHQLRARLLRHGLRLEHQRILDIGCGYFYPYTLLFASAGAWVVGADVDQLQWAGLRRSRYDRFRQESGVLKGGIRFGYDLCRQALYYGALRRSAGIPFNAAGAHLARLDAARAPFRDAEFDLCVSSAAFEHIADVPATVRELARILRPGGFADIEIHLFPSLSGGHEFVLYNHAPPPPGFRVWGHLLDPEWQPPVPLNRWREAQYRTAFEAHFEIVDRTVSCARGDAYLTDGILARLPAFTREELLTESVVYVLRRRDG